MNDSALTADKILDAAEWSHPEIDSYFDGVWEFVMAGLDVRPGGG
jgi:hypothetical protein